MWEDNIRMDHKEIAINTRNWIDSTQDRDNSRALVKLKTNTKETLIDNSKYKHIARNKHKK